MDMDVVCLGQCAWDLLTVVHTFPPSDSKIEAARFFEQGGGPAATAAVTLSRLGAKAAYIGKIGDDYWGQQIIAGLIEEGVDTQGLIVEQGRSSPLSLVVVEKDTGRRTIVHSRGTVSPLSGADINKELCLSGKIVLIDSLHPQAASAAAKMAKDKGIWVVLDTGAFKPNVTELLTLVDVVIAPEYFTAEYSTDRGIADVAHELLNFGSQIVVITQGEDGGLCFTQGEEFAFLGFKVEVVDTTGAGDVFHGAFAYGVLQEWDLKKSAAFASAVAALKCTELGGRTGIPSLEEAFEFLRERSMWM